MERTGALIERLLQQYHDNADAGKMLMTVQLLAAELQQQAQAVNNTGRKVSVVMPKYVTSTIVAEEVLDIPRPEPQPVKPVPQQLVQPVIQPVTEQVIAPPPPIPEPPKPTQPWKFDPVHEIPTLAHQQKTELNEAIGDKGESLNERLKANNVELGAMLQSSPVKDLKKAIGINDRYVFINELFRGDEVMYERSIKTINSYSNLAEAEYWIKRELKLKLAWSEDSATVRNFDQLVKRRFS